MKKTFLFIISVAFLSSVKAQAPTELWGITEKGGYGYGTVFKTDNNGNNLTVTDAFKAPIAGKYPPEGRFCEASNGKLYGVMNGGIYDNGILVELDPATGAFSKRTDFNQPVNGMAPNGLVKANNGKLYGTTLNGGPNEMGTLFEYDIITNTLVTKITFTGTTNGSAPYGDLMLAANGKLYGVTQGGGANYLGVLYEYDPATDTCIVKIDFTGINGSSPKGSLIQLSNGKLYGATMMGGINDQGTIYEYDIAADTLISRISFGDSITGSNPFGGLELANDGWLYGTTSSGTGPSTNGILYKYNPADAAFVKILDFDQVSQGMNPYGSLKKCSNGLLYGTTNRGGSTMNGTLFEFNPITSAFSKLIDFDQEANVSGRHPYASLMQASNGKLYGTTGDGGTNNRGVVFEYNIVTHAYRKVVDMGDRDGEAPRGTLMLSSNGKLYGTAAFGGLYGSGVLFECDPAMNKGKFTRKFDFERVSSGDRPVFAPQEATNGKLYGTTELGGDFGSGTIYEFNPATNSFVKKIDFDGVEMGRSPGGLLLAANKKMYGMATYGGKNNEGVLFEFDPATGIFTKKQDFKGIETGAYPHANLIQSSINGKLYGLTSYADCNHRGVLFEYDIVNDTLIKKIEFGGPGNGDDPEGSLIEVNNGHLYGLTAQGGTADAGIIFEYDPINDLYAKKYDFNITDGSAPYGSLMHAANGKLYGMTLSGGGANRGTLFEYDWIQNQFTKKITFDGSNGMSPKHSTLLEVCKSVYITPQPPYITICEKKPLIIYSGSTGPEYTYEWFKDGKLIKDSVSNIYKANASKIDDAGKYYCKISNGCRSINSPIVNVDIKPFITSECFVVSTDNERVDQSQILVYPNPAVDHFNVQINVTDVKYITVEVFDLLGHVVQNETRASDHLQVIDISILNSGVYMLKISGATGNVLKNERLIKY